MINPKKTDLNKLLNPEKAIWPYKERKNKTSLFVEETKLKLGVKAQGRRVEERDSKYVLHEDATPYSAHFDPNLYFHI